MTGGDISKAAIAAKRVNKVKVTTYHIYLICSIKANPIELTKKRLIKQ